MTNDQAAAYLAGIVDGEGCISICQLKNGPAAGEYRRVITIGMTDKEIIDLIAELYQRLNIGFSRSERQPKAAGRKYVWTISIQSRKDIIRFAEQIPIQHLAKQKALSAILTSYKTAKVYARPAHLANVIVRKRARLEPLAPHPDGRRHGVQFLQRVRDHVAHDHPAKAVAGIVDIDWHNQGRQS